MDGGTKYFRRGLYRGINQGIHGGRNVPHGCPDGIENRRSLESVLDDELKRAAQQGSPVSLLATSPLSYCLSTTLAGAPSAPITFSGKHTISYGPWLTLDRSKPSITTIPLSRNAW